VGRLDRIVVESECLAGNAAGDPTRRELYVYVPDRVEGDGLPSIYVLQGFAGRVEEWVSGTSSQAVLIGRLDAAIEAGDCPPALVAFVDGWSSRGTSQFLNSSGTGRYMDYLCDEIVPLVDRRYGDALAGRRGICGNSSGGYGALVVSMLRPGIFAALAAHAPDALFECCYQPLFPHAARELRDGFGGSLELFRSRISIDNWTESPIVFAALGTAAAYTPDPADAGAVLLPFELATGRLIDEVWGRWLDLDPVRMAERHADTLAAMRLIHLDAGRDDRFFLDLGAQALSSQLVRVGVENRLELFDGGHEIPVQRRLAAIAALARALGAGTEPTRRSWP
jgi:enterochelin esterase-like enzyme